jgi:hypothetical protein
MVRTLFMSAALLLAGNVAGAQITTYIPPTRPLAPSPLAVAAADSAHKDSVAQASITNMKAWVDSAAGVSVPAHVGSVDSSALANDPGRPATTTFSNGSVAPATASNLPTLAVVGVVVLAIGAALITTRARS